MYICTDCQQEADHPFGYCKNCSVYGGCKEIEGYIPSGPLKSTAKYKPQNLRRIKTIPPVDHVSNDLVKGFLYILASPPGFGKSTLCAQIAGGAAEKGGCCVYICGEESQDDVSERAIRLSAQHEHFYTLESSIIEEIVSSLDKAPKKPSLLIIDSIQLMRSSETKGEAGSISQVRSTSDKIKVWCKKNKVTCILVCHVTKDPNVTMAGPRTLEHSVDGTFFLQKTKMGSQLILTMRKHRGGDTSKSACFVMTAEGLKWGNPKHIYSSPDDKGIGVCKTLGIIEKSPHTITIQALVSASKTGKQEIISPFEKDRVKRIILLLKRFLLNSHEVEIFESSDLLIDLHHNLKYLDDRFADFGILSAIYSAFKGYSLPDKMLFCGVIDISSKIHLEHGTLNDAYKSAIWKGYSVYPATTLPQCKEGFLKIIQSDQSDE